MTKCTIPGCQNPKPLDKNGHANAALCRHHRWMKEAYGDPLATPPSGPTPAERFWSKVRKTEGCWEWTASCGRGGYGRFTVVENGRKLRPIAHRFSWELARGPIPDGLFVCHTCDNPKCVRPAHLFLGDAKANKADEIAKGRHSHGDRHWTKTRPERLARGIRNARYTRPWTTPRGEKHGRSKLTYAKADEIRARVAAGETQRALAAEFGVNKDTVLDIMKGRRWMRP